MAFKALKAVRPLIIPLVLVSAAFAQTVTRVDYPTQISRKPITSGTTVPGSCVFNGDIFYNTATGILWTCSALTYHAPPPPSGALTLTGLTVNGTTALNGLTTLGANAYNGLSSLTDGSALRGYNTQPNAANLAGGYFDFTPILYNTDKLRPGTVCHDIYGNVVTQPIPLTGLSVFLTQDTLMWSGPSPAMPDRWNPYFEAGITAFGFTYYVGQIIEDANRHLQKVTTAGISGTGPVPTFSTTGGTTADGTVVWTDQGLSDCGLPLLVNTVNGLNINSYFFALGGLGTMNSSFDAIQAFRGGVTAQSYTGGQLYASGTVVGNAWVESVTLTPHAAGALANAAFLGGYIQPGHSIGPPAAGTILQVSNPLTVGDGLAQGTMYWDDTLACLNIWNGVSWHCAEQAITGSRLNLTTSLAPTALFTAPTTGNYLVSAVMHIVSTNGAGTLGTIVTSPHAGDRSLTPYIQDLDPLAGLDGFMAALPYFMNAGDTVSLQTSATGLTGTTYNVYVTGTRINP